MGFGSAYLFNKKAEDMRRVQRPSAVVPAHGICDSGRPAKCPLSARSAGHARKPLARPSGASIPCAPGWLVRNVAMHDGERGRTDEGVAGGHA